MSCRKVCYPKKAWAIEAGIHGWKVQMFVYWCVECSAWHLTKSRFGPGDVPNEKVPKSR